MKSILPLLLATFLQACSVGGYYVLSGTGEPADNINLYEDDGVAVTLFHFDGKSSAILLSSKTDRVVSINTANISVITHGQALQKLHQNKQKSQIQLSSGKPYMLSFSYVTSSKPSPVTEEIIFRGSVNGKEINISTKYDLATKSYGWLEATRGI